MYVGRPGEGRRECIKPCSGARRTRPRCFPAPSVPLQRCSSRLLAPLYEARTLSSSSTATKKHLETLTGTNAGIDVAAAKARAQDLQFRPTSSAFSPPFIEPSITQRPPAPWQRLGQAPRQQDGRGRARCAIQLLVFAGVTAGFIGAAYGARHRPRDIAFLAVTYWLIALLLCLVEKLETLRLGASASAARGTERRRVRLAVWAIAVALSNTVAWRVTDAVPFLALKLAVWVITLVVLGFAYYFIFRCKADECCDAAEHGHAQADAVGRGPPPEKTFHGMSPEEKV